MHSVKLVVPMFVALIGAHSFAGAAPILGSALASFAVLGAAGVTNVPSSTIGGNLGSAPNASVGGGYVFSSGSSQPNTAIAQNAQIQLDAAILAVNAGVGTAIPNGNLDVFQGLNGGFIAPGTYDVGFATQNLLGNLILNGGGSNSAIWRFRFSSSLITSTVSNVSVVNVGDGANVGLYWTVGSAATLNGPTFAGNVLANQLISSDGNLTMACGRLLSAESQVTLIQDSISITGCNSNGYDQGGSPGGGGGGPGGGGGTVSEPSTVLLAGLALTGLLFGNARSRRRVVPVVA